MSLFSQYCSLAFFALTTSIGAQQMSHVDTSFLQQSAQFTPIASAGPFQTLPPQTAAKIEPRAPYDLQASASMPYTRPPLKPSYSINFCNTDEFPDVVLAHYGLQRNGRFVWNSSCSQTFFQCSFNETYPLRLVQ
ncbi:unnamed protein product [Anisakis simplex]|uniref:Secreted protein n=1 Tax=Anisakis simplex TaxID=6269 RepID=A0A0M3J4Z9_ANISI|nr:unnamed protein product [Anisakis simplex]